MALSTYDKQYLSHEDQEKILNLQKAYATASKAGDTAGKKSAAEAAENVRRAYGYSGGADGQQFETLPGYEGAGELQKAGENLVKAYTGINDAYKAQAEASKADIEKQRVATLKQAYVGNMTDQKNVDQQMRAAGITGGLSESARVAMQNNYRTNRNDVDATAMEAKKDVDLSTQQAIAQNEVNRANAEYNADVTKAQFQNTVAANNRNIKLTEESNKLAKEQADISKYTTFIQNGLVDGTNSKQIATALGVSEDSVKIAAEAARNGDVKSMALSLMSSGIYDDSFVKLFGGHFSAETLKTFANNNKKIASSPSYTRDNVYKDDTEDSIDLSNVGIEDMAKALLPVIENSETVDYSEFVSDVIADNYGKNYTASDWKQTADELGVTVERAKELFASVKRIKGVK